MNALDTNVLVRFLVQDDPRQGATASRRIQRAIAANETLFVPDVVLCETVWVLDSAYDVPKPRIVQALRSLLEADHLEIQSHDAATRAVAAFETGRGDFSDYLVREHARRAGCSAVLTFDRALLAEPGFSAP